MSAPAELRVTPCTWHGGRQAALTFSFDDAHREVIEGAVPLLEARGWRCTYAVPADFPLAERLPEAVCPGAPPCARWDELRRLTAAGHEVCSHSRTHPRLGAVSDEALVDEVQRSRALLAERMQARAGATFVYPFGEGDARARALATQTYLAGRGTVFRLNAATPGDLHFTAAILVQRPMSLELLRRWLDQCVEAGAWMIQAHHAIVNEDAALWQTDYAYCWSVARFSAHLEDVAARAERVWVASHEAVASYIRRRDGVRVSSVEREVGLHDVEVAVTPAPNDDLEAAAPPLTLRVESNRPGRLVDIEGLPSTASSGGARLVDVPAGVTRFRARSR